MKIGYARVSIDAQETNLQTGAIKLAMRSRVDQKKASEVQAERPELIAALAEFERDILSQRLNAGPNAARRRGRVGVGRPLVSAGRGRLLALARLRALVGVARLAALVLRPLVLVRGGGGRLRLLLVVALVLALVRR